MSNHLFDYVRAAATFDEEAPARPFLETPQGRKLTYGDVLAGSARFANALVAAGVKPGDRVAVQVEKSPEALLLYLGCVRAGAVFLPLNTAYTTAELDYFVGDAEPSLLVCDPAKREALAGIAKAAARRALETLDAHGEGSLAEKAEAAPRPTSRMWRASRRTSPPSSTPPARPAARRARCSPTRTSPRTP